MVKAIMKLLTRLWQEFSCKTQLYKRFLSRKTTTVLKASACTKHNGEIKLQASCLIACAPSNAVHIIAIQIGR